MQPGADTGIVMKLLGCREPSLIYRLIAVSKADICRFIFSFCSTISLQSSSRGVVTLHSAASVAFVQRTLHISDVCANTVWH